jgi:hypothetical protein
MQALNNLKLDRLVSRPDHDVARCDLHPRVANLEALTATSGELHTDIEFIVAPNMSTRALPRARVADRFDNPGSSEIVLFHVSIERPRKSARDLELHVARTEHRFPGICAVP